MSTTDSRENWTPDPQAAWEGLPAAERVRLLDGEQAAEDDLVAGWGRMPAGARDEALGAPPDEQDRWDALPDQAREQALGAEVEEWSEWARIPADTRERTLLTGYSPHDIEALRRLADG